MSIAAIDILKSEDQALIHPIYYPDAYYLAPDGVRPCR